MLHQLQLLMTLARIEVGAGGQVPEPFEPMAFLVGHCWEGTFPDGATTDRHCFEWVYDQKFIRDRHVVRRDGPDYRGESIYAWDPKQEALTYRYWASDGGVSGGSVRPADGELFFSDERHTAEDGTERLLRTRWRRTTSGESFLAVTEERREESWIEAWRVDYRRVGEGGDWGIAFNSTRDGDHEVYLMKPDGRDPRNLSRHEGVDWIYASYDGVLVAASRRDGRARAGRLPALSGHARSSEMAPPQPAPRLRLFSGPLSRQGAIRGRESARRST